MSHNPWTQVLVRMRKQKRLTQEQAAEGAQVSKNTWYRWENKNFNPSDKNLQKAADALRCTIEELNAAHRDEMPDFPWHAGVDPAAPSRTEIDKLRAGESMVYSIQRLLGDDIISDPLVERLLGRSPEADPDSTPEERFSDLLHHVTTRTQVLVAATTHILTDIQLCYPHLEHAARDDEKKHLIQVYADLLDHLSLSQSMMESLREISSLRLEALRAALGEELFPDDG